MNKNNKTKEIAYARKPGDIQLRIQEIDNGYLVLSGNSQFFCNEIDDVMIRIDALIMLTLKNEYE